MDAPTVRILTQMSNNESRMIEQSKELREQLPELGKVEQDWVDALIGQDNNITSLVMSTTD